MTIINPFEFATKAREVLDNINARAALLYAAREDYTLEGLSKQWEATSSALRGDRDRLAALADAAEAGITATKETHRAELIPANPSPAPADEMKFQRLHGRMAGRSGLDAHSAALETLEAALGTPFAGLWAEEMEARGILDPVALEGELEALSPDYARTVRAMTAAETILNNIMRPYVRALDEALEFDNVTRAGTVSPDSLPGYVLSLYAVEDIVAAPFKWSDSGNLREWGTNYAPEAA